jgi:aquaporin Z
LFAGDLAMSQLWLFIVAPLIGAALGALVWQGLMSTKEN